MRTFPLCTFVWVLSTAAWAGPVEVDGDAVPGATSSVSIEQEITEFRSGNDAGTTKLVPGAITSRVCVTARSPVASLEAALAPPVSSPTVQIVAEDGRTLTGCRLESVETVQPCGKCRKRATQYCLRCEGHKAP